MFATSVDKFGNCLWICCDMNVSLNAIAVKSITPDSYSCHEIP